MIRTLVKITVSAIALWQVGGCVPTLPANKGLPEVRIPDLASTSLDEFNVRGYVIAVVVCPPKVMCIRMDGVDIGSEPVAMGDPDYLEQMQKLRDRREIMTLPIGVYRRFNLEIGQGYLFNYKRGRGVVGVSALE